MTYPSVFINWLMGAELSAAGAALGRITGFALLALGVGCWSAARGATDDAGPVRAMLTYGFLVAVYLLFLGFGSDLVGILLWPAVVVHALFTFLLARAWYGPSS
jgi:Ca2+/Na+ antiporter